MLILRLTFCSDITGRLQNRLGSFYCLNQYYYFFDFMFWESWLVMVTPDSVFIFSVRDQTGSNLCKTRAFILILSLGSHEHLFFTTITHVCENYRKHSIYHPICLSHWGKHRNNYYGTDGTLLKKRELSRALSLMTSRGWFEWWFRSVALD